MKKNSLLRGFLMIDVKMFFIFGMADNMAMMKFMYSQTPNK